MSEVEGQGEPEITEDVSGSELESMVSHLSEESIRLATFYGKPYTLRRLYERCCLCGWVQRRDTLLNTIAEKRAQQARPSAQRCTIRYVPGMLDTMRDIQRLHDKVTLHSTLRTRCLTGDIPSFVFRAIPKEYALGSRATLGGMSRIYYATHEPTRRKVVVKITDVAKSLGGHELNGYHVLQNNSLPSARVYYHTQAGTYHVTIIERLECTLTTLILAISTNPKAYGWVFKDVIEGVECLLHALWVHRLAFVDLTTDNIMCRSKGEGMFELVLIDPQFVVPMSLLGKRIGITYAENIDRIHVCIKFLCVSRLKTGVALAKHANELCKNCLGYVPSVGDVIGMLTKRVPGVVRTAYDILHAQTAAQKNSAL